MISAVFDISVAFFHGKVCTMIYVLPPKDLRKKVKIWSLLKSLYGTRDASLVFATYVPGSKTVGKGLRDGADSLDKQDTQQYRSLVGTALYVGQDRPEKQYATKEAARFMSGPTRAARCMLKRLCKHCSEAPVLSWSFPCVRCELGRRTGSAAIDVVWMDLFC